MTSGRGLNFRRRPWLAQLLAGLDEGAGDVAVLDEAVVLRQPRRARQPAGGRVPGVGDRDHEVRLHRSLPPQDLAHPPARHLQDLIVHARVRPREVDVLEHAQRPPAAGGDLRLCSPSSPSVTTSPGSTSRKSFAPMMSKAHDSLATQ